MSTDLPDFKEFNFPLRERIPPAMIVLNLLFGGLAVFLVFGALIGLVYFLWPPNFDLGYAGFFGLVGIPGAILLYSTQVGRYGTLRLRLGNQQVEVFEHLFGLGFKKGWALPTIVRIGIRDDRRAGVFVQKMTGKISEFGWSLSPQDKVTIVSLIHSHLDEPLVLPDP